MTYLEKLEAAVQKSSSTLCVGLDPNLDLLPDQIRHNIGSSSELILHFCKKVIDATYEHCAAYKPNLAFFEAIGKKGLRVLSEVIEYIPEGHVVITDAKRGDISSTAEHYKKAFFKKFEADAITLNPLMGFETLDAFSEDETKGIYTLALTSNPGADDFLKKPFEGFDMMAEYIADKLFERSVVTEAHLGMVIGATQSNEARAVIEHHSKASLLIPGIGAQGGSIDELANTLAGHEGIPLINSSRGIIYAGSEEDNWQEHVEQAAIAMKEQLSMITQTMSKKPDVTVYTDGACSGNPGPGGWGAILIWNGNEKELSGGDAQTTNNRMEMKAVIEALKALKKPCKVSIHSDSALIINAMTKGWIENWQKKGWRKADKKPVENKELWEQMLKAMEPHDVHWVKVKAHVGIELNERVDQLAVKESKKF